MAPNTILLSLFLILRLERTIAFVPCFEQACALKPSVRWATAPSEHDVDDANERMREALAKMNVVMTSDFFLSSPTLKQFYTKLIKNIEVRESSIPGAGRGLFASKAIKANTIVSFYPAHALGMDSESPFVTAAANTDDQQYFASNPSSKSAYLHCADQPIFGRSSILGTTTNEPLYLDVNPQRRLVDGWVSQMINDGATVMDNSETGILNYYRETKRAKNCIHIPWGPSPVLATVTTKKVLKGEELLTTYGGTYWLGVWLNVHGQEGVAITDAIQSEIKESAQDLFASMKSVSVVYANQLEAFQSEFDKI
jgi:hypothetical protein